MQTMPMTPCFRAFSPRCVLVGVLASLLVACAGVPQPQIRHAAQTAEGQAQQAQALHHRRASA